MKCLRIDDKCLKKHNEYFKHSLILALDRLACGKTLKFRDRRGRGKKFLKKTLRVRGVGLFYVRLVKALLNKYDVLVSGPHVLQRCVRILDWVEYKKFPKKKKSFTKCKKKYPKKRKSRAEKEYEDAKRTVQELFNYEEFGGGKRLHTEVNDPKKGVYCIWKQMEDWSAWHFMQTLDVGACAYCNGGGVFSLRVDSKLPGSPKRVIEGGDKKRSPFDHFFGHSKYPCLGLSLFNLVPSCTRCNTNMKGAQKQDIDSFVHPYLESFDEGAKFYAIFEKYSAISFPIEERSSSIWKRSIIKHMGESS